MANELPLKIRVDIRDLWNSPQSPLRATIAGLTTTLGHKITPQVQWPLLWDSLKKEISDPANFIPAIVTYTSSWYEQLNWRLENDDAYGEWTEKLLSILPPVGNEIFLHIEAQGSPNAGALRTHWDSSFKSFYLLVPRGSPKPSSVSPSLVSEFDNLFDEGGSTKPKSSKKQIDEDGWADVEEPEIPSVPTGAPRATKSRPEESQVKMPKKLPTIASLARPSDLFQSTTPYILIVETGNPMMVQCSHQKSLDLLSQYLNKWGKPNRNDAQKRNILGVDLVESDFAMGVHDLLRIDPNISYGRTGPINPTFVLAFVEGVLGYKFLHASGNRYVYRSDDVIN